MQRPRLYLAFANARNQYLNTLNKERKAIITALQPLYEKDLIRVYAEGSATIDDVFEYIANHNDIAVFHYSGHAAMDSLLFETEDGNNEVANSTGLAELLGTLPGLKLVVLNGCATNKQVALLLEKGVSAVIATSNPVKDLKAYEFASKFYNALARGKSLNKAFTIAAAFIKSKHGKTAGVYRGMGPWRDTMDNNDWGLFVSETEPQVLNWRLPVRTFGRVAVSLIISAVIILFLANLIAKRVNSSHRFEAPITLQIENFQTVGSANVVRPKVIIQQIVQRLSYTTIQTITPEIVETATQEYAKASLLNIPLSFSVSGGLVSGATHILSGNIASSKSSATIEVELREVRTNKILWREEYPANYYNSNSSNISIEIARSITDKLNISLTESDSLRQVQRFTTDPKAQDQYNKALISWAERDSFGFNNAIRALKYAIELDSSFTEAYGLLSLVYVTGASRSDSGMGLDTSMKQAFYYGDRALNMNRHCVNGLIGIGSYFQDYKYDYKLAKNYLSRAITLAPTDGLALQANAELYLKVGIPDSSLIFIQRAEAQLIGNRTVEWLKAKILMANGHLDRSIKLANEKARLDSLDKKTPNYHMWEYYTIKHQFNKAIRAIPTMGEGTEAMFQAFTYLEARDYSAFENSVRKVRPEWRTELNLFRLAREGKKEQVSRELGRIMSEKGNLNFIWLIQTDPFEVFNDLRADPSAAQIMSNYGIAFRPHPYLGQE